MTCNLKLIDKAIEYVLVYPKFIADTFRVAIEEFKHPVSTQESRSMIRDFIVKGIGINQSSSGNNIGYCKSCHELHLPETLILFLLSF
jgi:hypothetical protein